MREMNTDILSNQPNKVVALYPFSSQDNPYLRLTQMAIEDGGYCVAPCKTPGKYSASSSPSFLVLNWFDEIKGNPLSAIARFVKRYTEAVLSQRRGTKVIFVIHNRVPHDGASNVSTFLSRRLRLVLCQRASAIVGLCTATKDVIKDAFPELSPGEVDRKFHYVPHPTYAPIYDFSFQGIGDVTRPEKGTVDSSFTFLFVGLIRPYKNVELILRVARYFEEHDYQATFVIAGKALRQSYLDELRCAAPGNVRIREGFVPDDEMCSLIKGSDALILPYNIESSLNSGTCMLAFTFGRTVICPDIGTLEGIPDDLVYKYTYVDAEGHERHLLAESLRAYRDKLANPIRFAENGDAIREIVLQRHSISEVGRAWSAVFEAVEE